jgi:hypothetical protein
MYSASSMLAKAKDNSILPDRRNNSLYYREVYLKSDHWKLLREEKLAKNACCEKCGTNLSVEVHHKNYRGLYDVKLSDLQTLCRICHDKAHKKPKKRKKRKQLKRKIQYHNLYGKPAHLSPRNKERQEMFDKMIGWRQRDMSNYISIHY